ncbi:MAG: hypothetical protein HUK02_08070 [Bacteroidaceae bacterium]|nr:hypothetical protein [Bacteroidaceae bacterium]
MEQMKHLVQLILVALLTLVGTEQAGARSAAAVAAVGSPSPCAPCGLTLATAPAAVPAKGRANSVATDSQGQNADNCDFLAKKQKFLANPLLVSAESRNFAEMKTVKTSGERNKNFKKPNSIQP